MWRPLEHLQDLSVELGRPSMMNDLPRVIPRFFVPPLENKPQNPIMETLKLEDMNSNLPTRSYKPQYLPPELAILSLGRPTEEESAYSVEQLWTNALIRKAGLKNGLLSWDRLRPSHSTRAFSTAFLSEQDDLVYASALYHVQPRTHDSTTSILYVTEQELLVSLKKTALGISSPLHNWDPLSETFIQVGAGQNRKQGIILVDGKDEVVGSSLISRFLTIGTLLRRLESLLVTLRSKSAKEGPTIHAFGHSLSTTLIYLRDALTRCPPSTEQISTGKSLPLSAIWSQYEIYDDLLVALASLYQREESLSPKQYPPLHSSPTPLLSHVCDCLNVHFERQSSSIICATMAFILTSTSQEYIQEIARSVGSGGQPPRQSRKSSRERDEYDFDADEEDEEEDLLDLLDKADTTFPSFFPQELLRVLPAAQKSLILLRIAQPDHPMLTSELSTPSVRWIWTVEEINAMWNGLSLPSDVEQPQSASPSSPLHLDAVYKLDEKLTEFQLFDLEPGHADVESSLKINDTSAKVLVNFIQRFPKSLPPITPTFSQLASLTFRDLVQHSSTLSSTLLSLFITSKGVLNFRSHLILLRSYLLIAAPSFKSRLLAALFSDAGTYEVDQSPHSMSIRSLRRKPSKKTKDSEQPWAVGLSLNLLDRETWPPVGADLSFFLRTVIVDSLEKGENDEEEDDEDEKVNEEAVWRLGFAIRDLPTGPGRDKWLNPLSIEALDFLYMDYKPPRPLEILISPDILSKYQRMFAFILRLLRVESALKSLFRMSTHRSTSNFLFPTLTKSRQLLLHFRFISQATSLSNSNPNMKHLEFSDVFELAQCHSSLMDDILSACLLRSGQKGVGDLLRHSLELVLEFTIVVGELHRGRFEEYQAASMIEDLFQRFRSKMTTLTKVLKGLVDKSSSSSLWPIDASAGGGRRRPTGGHDALYHLLIRLDLTDWWCKPAKS
ncbi:Spc98 family-domain-containing protein [Crassisporium funariophilum]|nr:Spc98 family-domain-containing protein [Crassisporium funariophilum]